MRRLRNDLPYTFRPPTVKAWFRPLAVWLNRRWLLGRKYRIEGIEERGFDGLVPVGMRFHHNPAVEATFSGRLDRLEDRIGWTPKPSMPVRERILRLGAGVMALKETEFLGDDGGGEASEAWRSDGVHRLA